MTIPIYPPTSTETWDQCKLKHYLQHDQRLIPRQATRALVGQLIGRGAAVGTARILNGSSLKDATEAAQAELLGGLNHHTKHGVLFDGPIEVIADASGLDTGMKLFYNQAPFKSWKVEDIERRLPDHGRARIDVGGHDQDGILSVADVKFKRNLAMDYKSNTVSEYLSSWQFMHYPWAYGEYKNEPCYRMYLCLIVLKPKQYIELIPNEVHPELQQMWLSSAKAKWSDMARSDAVPEMAAKHKDQFGWCPYYKACFDYHLDEGLIANDYVMVPREG